MGHPWLAWGTVAVIVVAAVCIGAFVRASRAPARAVVRKCEWVGCAHTYPQHEGDGGPCRGQVQRIQSDGETGWEPCACPAYQGVLPPGVEA